MVNVVVGNGVGSRGSEDGEKPIVEFLAMGIGRVCMAVTEESERSGVGDGG